MVSCWHQKRPTNKPANFLKCVENTDLFIAPPTIYNGKRYTWINDTKIAEANDSVLDLATMKGRTQKTSLPHERLFYLTFRHYHFNTLDSVVYYAVIRFIKTIML